MIRGPWYITQKALEDYVDIIGGVDSPANLRRAEEALLDMAQDAVDSDRVPGETESGLLRYRGPAPYRLTLVVSTVPRKEGSLPQLVGATCDPRAKRKIREALGQPKQPGPGRPTGTRKVSSAGAPHGGVEVKLRLHPDQADWLRAQPGGAQAWLRQQIEAAMEIARPSTLVAALDMALVEGHHDRAVKLRRELAECGREPDWTGYPRAKKYYFAHGSRP